MTRTPAHPTDAASTRDVNIATVSAVLGATLGAAFLNVAVSAGEKAAGLATPGLLFPVIALSVTFLAPVTVATCLGIRALFRRNPDSGATALFVALLGIVAAAAILPAVDWAPWRHPLTSLVSAAAMGMALLFALRFSRSRSIARLPGLGAGAAAFGAASLGVAWWTAYAVADAGPATRALGWLVYIGVAAGLVAASLRSAPPRSTLTALAVVFLAIFAAAAPAAIGGAAPSTPSPDGTTVDGRPRHIILLTVDTLRPDALGVQSAEGPRTPQIDALLADSVVFSNARSSSPWTKASVASFLTGTSPYVHRTVKATAQIPAAIETLAEGLQNEGYRTAAIEFNPHLSPAFGFSRGFDTYQAFPQPPIGDSLGAKLYGRLGYRTHPTSRELTDQAVAWVTEHANQSFFFWLHYLDPHLPYEAPPEFLPADAPPEEMNARFGFTDLFDVRTGRQLSREQRRWVRSLYDAEVRYVDREAGRFLAALKQLGIYDDALVVFTSDHGEEFWEHDGFEHGHTFYDELLRVPLAFKLPGQVATGTLDASVPNASIPATVREIAGIRDDPASRNMPSLKRLWDTPGSPVPSEPHFSISSLYFDDGVSVVFDGMKYIERIESEHQQLFDLEADSGETESLARREPTAVARARGLLDQHREQSESERRRLEIDDDTSVTIDPAMRDHLESLGYIH